jgi:hypothetical protein
MPTRSPGIPATQAFQHTLSPGRHCCGLGRRGFEQPFSDWLPDAAAFVLVRLGARSRGTKRPPVPATPAKKYQPSRRVRGAVPLAEPQAPGTLLRAPGHPVAVARGSFPPGPVAAAGGPAARRRCGAERGPRRRHGSLWCYECQPRGNGALPGAPVVWSVCGRVQGRCRFTAGSVCCTHPGCRNPHHRQPPPGPPPQAPARTGEGGTP